MDEQLVDLELIRARLEDNVVKIRGLLRHWQTWEAEYEGFREALSGLEQGATQQDIKTAAADVEGELLTTKEIEGLLKDKGQTRSAKQVLGVLSRRIDYVQDNVKAVSKNLEAEQRKLDQANFADHRDESGLPLTEITEELDEEGNVISSSVSKPGDAAPQIIDALRRSGLDELSTSDSAALNSNTDETGSSSISKKENVSFADAPNETQGRSDQTKRAEIALRQATPESVDEAKPDGSPTSEPTILEKESPEDIALRREMLQYGMEEVNAVVAQMNLDDEGDDSGLDYDDSNDDSNSDDYNEDECDDGDEDEVEEDQFGRTTTRVIDNEYRAKMLELQRKLKVRPIVNAGLEPTESAKAQLEGNNAKIEVGNGNIRKKSAQKSVRFADDLDIQDPPPKPASGMVTQSSTDEIPERPITADIFERQSRSDVPSSSPQAPKNVSRYRASRAGQQGPLTKSPSEKGGFVVNGPLAAPGLGDRLVPATKAATNRFQSIPKEPLEPRTVLEGPTGKTHTETLVERPMAKGKSKAKEPDDLDPVLMDRHITTEYNRIRNRMIQKQDGFMTIDNEELEDEEGKRKMSRFKAARLSRSLES